MPDYHPLEDANELHATTFSGSVCIAILFSGLVCTLYPILLHKVLQMPYRCYVVFTTLKSFGAVMDESYLFKAILADLYIFMC